jgi:hypothetical protein
MASVEVAQYLLGSQRHGAVAAFCMHLIKHWTVCKQPVGRRHVVQRWAGCGSLTGCLAQSLLPLSSYGGLCWLFVGCPSVCCPSQTALLSRGYHATLVDPSTLAHALIYPDCFARQAFLSFRV